MSDLQNLTPANTYKGLLQVGDYTNGVDSTVRSVLDGEGTASALAISTTKVGIGTTSPTQELEVNGNVVADEYALDQTGSSSSAVAIHAPTTNELAIRTNTAERVRVDSAGNVGIGTTNPSSTLDVVGDIAATQNIKTERSIEAGLNTTASTTIVGVEARDARRVTAGSADPNQNWEFYNNGTSSFIGILDRTYNTYLSDNSLNADPSYRLVITNTNPSDPTDETGGRVGIGTKTPVAPLDVTSTTGGVIMPRMTTTQRNNIVGSGTNGEIIYNTTLNKFQGRANGSWVDLH